jgi:hypothetical protein
MIKLNDIIDNIFTNDIIGEFYNNLPNDVHTTNIINNIEGLVLMDKFGGRIFNLDNMI